ncbi:hypothetical protein VTI74DRAFT_5810 [Chaetomium olivicolor]
MAYPNYLDTTAFAAFQCHHGGWDDSVGMERTDSQSSSSTVNSNFSLLSGASSSTNYSVVDPALFDPRDAANHRITLSLAPSAISEPQDSNEVLYATGAQYQGGYNLPQESELSEPLAPSNSSRASIEQAAEHATSAANLMITAGQFFQDGGLFWITDKAVDRAIRWYQRQGVEVPDRLAVQDILRHQLYQQKVSNNMDNFSRTLQEAAYQLQRRLQGPEVPKICHAAIGAVLAEVFPEPEPPFIINARSSSSQVQLLSPKSASIRPQPLFFNSAPTLTANSAPAPPRAMIPPPALARHPKGKGNKFKEKHRCPFPGCTKHASRQADVERHYRTVHLKEEDQTKYVCDYRRCTRHRNPFLRQDHFRDHLRHFHKEDLLVRRGGKDDDPEQFWESRAPFAVKGGWWRCSRCLVRVEEAVSGFVCRGCGKPCESARREYRRRMNAAAAGE